MRFTKMEGLGNDYVYVDCFEHTVEDAPSVARNVSDRRFGIGGDGLILICRSDVADCRMEMYNADGSRGEMCGNGIRCVARYAHEQLGVPAPTIRIETDVALQHDPLPVFQQRAVRHALAPKQHARHLRVSILKGEVQVPGTLPPQVGDFAGHPEGADLLLDQTLHLRRQLAHGQYLPCFIRGEQFTEVPLGF